MYNWNSRETNQYFLSIIAVLTEEKRWNPIKYSIKTQQGRKRGKDENMKERKKETTIL